MRKLLILLCLPLIGFGQLTYVPDNWFEAYLENNGMGNGIQYDDSVFTSAINTVTHLDVSFGAGQSIGIFDLTGIEDFTALTSLECQYNFLSSLDLSNNTALTTLQCQNNQLTSLDVSNNTTLTHLYCSDNLLTSLDVSSTTVLYLLSCEYNQLPFLDVSNNIALIKLVCSNNQLTNLDVSQNIALTNLFCENNLLTSLDVSGATALDTLRCANNQLSFLDVRNGNNTTGSFSFFCTGNPHLTCINVDDSVYSTNNWWNIDSHHYFSNNCGGTTLIQEYSSNKKLLRTIDVLGRETKNKPLFYIYDDGVIEKRIIIE